MKNIVLIGMPGCGKTTFGRALAERLHRPFIDARQGLIIATGGGVVKRQSNVVKLHASGLIIFIDRRAEDIVTDVEVEKRPLLKEGPDKVFTLYKERIALYRAAADRILENRGSEKEVLARLLDMVKE